MRTKKKKKMALRAFRILWRTQRQVLGQDQRASLEARRRIRHEFRKNVGVSEEEAKRLIKVCVRRGGRGSDVIVMVNPLYCLVRQQRIQQRLQKHPLFKHS